MIFWTRLVNYFRRTGPKRWTIAASIVLPLWALFTYFPSFYQFAPELPPALASAPKAIFVDLDDQVLFAYENGKVVKRYLVVTSTAWYRTPPGLYKTSDHDANYTSKAYNAPMPFAMKVTHWGHYLHAGLMVKYRWRLKKLLPETWSKDVGSHGCINIEYFDSKRLFEWTPVGTPVVMSYNDPIADTLYNALQGKKNGMTETEIRKFFPDKVTDAEIKAALKKLKRGVADAKTQTVNGQTDTVWKIRWVDNPELKPS